MTKITVRLEKMAKKGGGDKYAGKIEESDFSIYIPQSISRPEGEPKKEFTITIS